MTSHRVILICLALEAATATGWAQSAPPSKERRADCTEEELKLPPCSPAITNGSCLVRIVREGPVAPIPIRLKPKANACVLINKSATETILFDAEFKDSLPPDPFAAVAAALVPVLKSFVGGVSVNTGLVRGSGSVLLSVEPRGRGSLFDNEYREIETKLARLTSYQESLRVQLAETKHDVSRLGRIVGNLKAAKDREAYEHLHSSFCTPNPGCKVEISVPSIGLAGTELKTLTEEVARIKLDTHNTIVLNESADEFDGLRRAEAARTAIASPSRTEKGIAKSILRADSKAALEEIERIVAGLSDADENQRRLQVLQQTLEGSRTGINQALDALPVPAESNWEQSYVLRASVDDQSIESRGANREVALKLTAQDTLSKEKKALTTVTVKWGVNKWELSTGLLISNLPGRTFANTIQFADGLPVADRFRVTEATTKFTIVPAALVHYRLWETGAKRRFAVLATGAAGVNAASASADFGGGLSLSWRSLVLSFLVHGSRDLQLTNGYAVGLGLPSGSPAPTTNRRWVAKGAIGISYRIPIP